MACIPPEAFTYIYAKINKTFQGEMAERTYMIESEGEILTSTKHPPQGGGSESSQKGAERATRY